MPSNPFSPPDESLPSLISTNVEAVLTNGSFKESLGSDLAYTVSASMACKEAISKAEPFLLEPIMDVEVYVPEAFMGDVIGDLNSRRGKIIQMEPQGSFQVIQAEVPLGEMFGYATQLRSLSQGRATYAMEFGHYEPAPNSIVKEHVEKASGGK